MSEAPERIWAWWDDAYDVGLLNEHGDKRYTPNDAKEYVRATRIEELEAKLELISEEWHGAVYGDLENGVASLNEAAAQDFRKRYPLVSNFGATLSRIIDGESNA